jgi:hypothetical protein
MGRSWGMLLLPDLIIVLTVPVAVDQVMLFMDHEFVMDHQDNRDHELVIVLPVIVFPVTILPVTVFPVHSMRELYIVSLFFI